MRIWLPVVVRTLSRNTHFSKLRVCFRAASRLLSLKFHVWTSLYTFDLTGPLLCTIKSPWKQSFWLLFHSIVSQKVRLYKKKTAQLLFTIQFRHFSCSRLCSRLYPILLLNRHCLIMTLSFSEKLFFYFTFSLNSQPLRVENSRIIFLCWKKTIAKQRF